MNVVKWCKKCGIVTWRKISTMVDRSKSVAINHKEIALVLSYQHHLLLHIIYSNRNKVIAIKVGMSSLTYWKSKAENIRSKNRGAVIFLYLRQLNVISHNCNAASQKR